MDRQAVRIPVGDYDQHWSTRLGCRSLLVLAPHIVALTRLLDVLHLVRTDRRVQVVITVSDDEAWELTHRFVAGLGIVVVPWHQARRMRFDLVLAASMRGVDEVRGPVLFLSHGGRLGQYRPWRPPSTGRPWEQVTGLDAQQLFKDGQVRADSIALTHDDELTLLQQRSRAAVPTAFVAGEIAFDRLLASAVLRDQYRRALGVRPRQELVLVTSSWSGRSAYGRHADLFDRVLAQLDPRRYRVVGALHPQIWEQHGPWQVRAWLRDSLKAGLGLLATPGGWRAAMCAADYLMGDYGSATVFGAGFGVPTLVIADDDAETFLPGTPTDELMRHAPHWRPNLPLRPQLDSAFARRDVVRTRVGARITSRPGHADVILRSEMYRLMRLSEPQQRSSIPLVAMPWTFRD